MERFLAACTAAALDPSRVRLWISHAGLPPPEWLHARDRRTFRALCTIIEGLVIPSPAHDLPSRHLRKDRHSWR